MMTPQEAVIDIVDENHHGVVRADRRRFVDETLRSDFPSQKPAVIQKVALLREWRF
jgi:hypothetical protein